MCIFIVNNGLSTCNTIGNEKKRVHCKQTRWKFLRFGHSVNNLILRIRNIENSCWTRSHVMTVSHHESQFALLCTSQWTHIYHVICTITAHLVLKFLHLKYLLFLIQVHTTLSRIQPRAATFTS